MFGFNKNKRPTRIVYFVGHTNVRLATIDSTQEALHC